LKKKKGKIESTLSPYSSCINSFVCSSVYFPAECLVIAISDFIFSSSSSFPLLSLVDQLAFPLMTQLVKKKKNKYQIDDSRIGNCSPSSFIEERHLRPRLRSLGIHWPVYLLFFFFFGGDYL
jgi:hypothetical protein